MTSNTTTSQIILRSEAETVLTVDLAIRAANGAKQIDVAFELAVGAAVNIVDKLSGHEPFAPELLRIQVVSSHNSSKGGRFLCVHLLNTFLFIWCRHIVSTSGRLTH